jgi:hypothetical protein
MVATQPRDVSDNSPPKTRGLEHSPVNRQAVEGLTGFHKVEQARASAGAATMKSYEGSTNPVSITDNGISITDSGHASADGPTDAPAKLDRFQASSKLDDETGKLQSVSVGDKQHGEGASYGFDKDGNVKSRSQVDSNGMHLTEYGPDGHVIHKTVTKDGKTQAEPFDKRDKVQVDNKNGKPVGITTTDGRETTKVELDQQGHVKSNSIDNLDSKHHIHAEFNSDGTTKSYSEQKTFPDGSQMHEVVGPQGERLSAKLPDGTKLEHSYDFRENISTSKITKPDHSTVETSDSPERYYYKTTDAHGDWDAFRLQKSSGMKVHNSGTKFSGQETHLWEGEAEVHI